MALGGGGNKLRKLEFHLGAALADKIDTIITVGGLQSNHARLAAAVTARHGLACELFLTKVVPRTDEEYEHSGNIVLGRQPTIQTTLRLTRETLALLGHSQLPEASDIDIDPTHRGEGYGIPTDEMIAAVRLLAQQEGLLIDPVYSGKAFAGLLADIRRGKYAAGDSVLFVMTGGTPGLYAYRSVFDPV
jgi:1-aminocyclopropane-1-carboxylate deaminase/D-cysteine desulfhydrase-like pyridoxal-dependent ACC family enzyme